MRFIPVRDTVKSRAIKILPVTCCSTRITSENIATLMIPIDQGEGGIPPFMKW